jgi:hypothetical protein
MGKSTGRHWIKAGYRVFAALVAALIASAATATPTQSGYCVRPIDVVPATESSDLERQFEADEPLHSPKYLGRSPGARYPLAYRDYTITQPDGHNSSHRLYWSYSPNYELVGPREFANLREPIVVGGGVSLALGSTDETLASGQHWQRHLVLRQREDGRFTEIDRTLQFRIAEPSLIAWSDVLHGFSVLSIKWRDGTKTDPMAPEVVSMGGPSRTGTEKFFVVKGDTAVDLPQVALYVKVVADLPSLGATGLLGSGSLVLVTPQLDASSVTRVDPGRHGFDALYETNDPGWIYAAGNPNDNAIHLEQGEGKWRATSIVRISRNDGRFGYAIRWLFGEPDPDPARDPVSRIIHAGWCRKFSTAIKRMIFCEEMSELRDGKLVPIADGQVALRQFVGDADSFGLALFVGQDGRLYGYDGDKLHLISGETFDTARVRDYLRLGRTLVSTPSEIFELCRSGSEFELVKLIVPFQRFDITDFYVAPDDSALLAFSYEGIYSVENTLTLIWPSAGYGSIKTNGGLQPTDVVGWNGILFVTADGRSAPQFHLIRSCKSPAR